MRVLYRSWTIPPPRCYDLLVVGGGINGAGLARDAAMRGLSVLLVDKGDFGSGTSSQSSKLIHGGIRYLEHGDFKLVFEACQERWILSHLAPHLVRPLPFLLPMYRTDRVKPLLMRVGLALYDAMAGWRNIGRHRMLSRAEVETAEPALSREGLLQGAWYYDAQMNDARLCLENILSAREHGATCLNYVELRRFRHEKQQAVAATLFDHGAEREFEVEFKACVNATGPWSDSVLKETSAAPPPHLRLHPSKGVHAVVDAITPHALLVKARRDGRVFFILPWGQYSLLGTTETDFQGSPDTVAADPSDIRYLLEETAGFFPQARLEKCYGTFAGLRPLLDGAGQPAGKLSREHAIIDENNGLISIVGGKYTTYRRVARQLADRVDERLGRRVQPAPTDREVLYGGDTGPMDSFVSRHFDEVARQTSHPGTARVLLNRYGSRYAEVLAACQTTQDGFAPICPHTDHVRGEVRYAFTTEGACTVEDFLRRRTWIAYGSCLGADAHRTVMDVLTRDMSLSMPLIGP